MHFCRPACADSRARQILIFLAGNLLAVMSPHHHRSYRRGRIARAGCHKATRMLCGMRSDGLEANVTLYVASPERVDSQQIEDGTAQNLRSAQLPLPPRTNLFGSILPQTNPCPSLRQTPIGVAVALRNQFFALYCETSSRYHLHARREDSLESTHCHDSEPRHTALSAPGGTVEAQKLTDAFVLLRRRRVCVYIYSSTTGV